MVDALVAPAGMVSCDTIITVRVESVGHMIGLFFEDQEPDRARAVSDALELFIP